MKRYEPYKSSVPEGKSGDWKVERFEVDEAGAKQHNSRCYMQGIADRVIVPGTYTKLQYKGRVIMSDTPAEITDHRYIILRAEGNVLISGLGLGIVTEALLIRGNVSRVTVIEKEQDVISLVSLHLTAKYGADKLRIIRADIFDWMPEKGVKFNYIWHDIWPTICEDNWPEMKQLKRRFARRKTQYQGCWMEDYIRREVATTRRQEKELAWLTA